MKYNTIWLALYSMSLTIILSLYLVYTNRERGKIIGGTKGNKVLEYISGAPVKEQVIDRIPNIFDYDELSKYGYSVRLFIFSIHSLGSSNAKSHNMYFTRLTT
jgi:hypothetical protein